VLKQVETACSQKYVCRRLTLRLFLISPFFVLSSLPVGKCGKIVIIIRVSEDTLCVWAGLFPEQTTAKPVSGCK